MDALEKLVSPGFVPIPSSRSAYDPFQNTVPSSQENNASVAKLNDRLDALEGSVRLLKGSEARDQVVKFGGLGFSTLADSRAWLDQNPEGISFGYFMDVYNLAEVVYSLVH